MGYSTVTGSHVNKKPQSHLIILSSFSSFWLEWMTLFLEVQHQWRVGQTIWTWNVTHLTHTDRKRAGCLEVGKLEGLSIRRAGLPGTAKWGERGGSETNKMLHATLFFLNIHHLLFFIRNPWVYTDDMYSFSHSYMHVTLFEIQKASRQCSIQTSLAVSPLSSDEMASSNPAKETGVTIRGRCTTNKNTEIFFF